MSSYEPKLSTIDELRVKASDMEAGAFRFLNASGTIAKCRNQFTHFEVKFIDGVVMTLLRADVETLEFEDLVFKLAPAQTN